MTTIYPYHFDRFSLPFSTEVHLFSAYPSKQIPLEMSSEVIPLSRIDVDFRFQNRAVSGVYPARNDCGAEME